MSKILSTLAADKNKHTMARTINTRLATTIVRTPSFNALVESARKHEPLTPAEEMDIFADYNSQPEHIQIARRNRVINSNLFFLISVASKYTKDGDKICELVDCGTIGLVKACEKYDLSTGFRFLSYAVHWIMQAISEHYLTEDNFVIKSNQQKIGSKAKKLSDRFYQTEMREPTEEELIEMLAEEGIEIKDRVDLLNVKTPHFEDTLSEDGDTVADAGEVAMRTASVNGAVEDAELEQKRAVIRKLMSALPVREQMIITASYFDEKTDEQIGAEMDMTAERVRQLRLGAEQKMRGNLKRVASMLA